MGDSVPIFEHTTPSGLKPKYRRRWTGPFVVKSVTGPLSYVVQSPNGMKEFRVHADHIKRAYKPVNGWPAQNDVPLARLERQQVESVAKQQERAQLLDPVVTPVAPTRLGADANNDTVSSTPIGVSSQTSSPIHVAPKFDRLVRNRKLPLRLMEDA